MGRTEIGVVVDDGMHVVCAFQQFRYLVAQYGVQGIIRPYYNDVVLLNLRILYIQALFGIIFIEDVFRIAPVVEERE